MTILGLINKEWWQANTLMNKKLPDIMPELNLSIPADRGSMDSVELNERLLKQWIKRLPSDDIAAYVSEYLIALKRFNRNQLEMRQRLDLLDIYRIPLNKILFELEAKRLIKKNPDPIKRDQLISDLSDLMSELAIGYKIIVVDALAQDSNLKLNPIALLAINRAGEQLSYIALHAYKFYRSIPANVLNELHQLYMLTLLGKVDEKRPKLAGKSEADSSFKSRYGQLLLVTICNPYGLASDDVLTAYTLMQDMASVIEIRPLASAAKARAGHFYINCLSDGIPSPSVLPMIENQIQPPTLVLDTKPVLVMVDLIFQRTHSTGVLAKSLDIELLKQLVPYLNTSYERKQQRSKVMGEQQVYLSMGLNAVHQCINVANAAELNTGSCFTNVWNVLNKNSSGYLVSKQHVIEQDELMVGDFVGIFEAGQQDQIDVTNVGFIRWKKREEDGSLEMGLSLIEGDPISVQVGVSGEDDSTLGAALFLPEIAQIQQSASLITNKNVYSAECKLIIKPTKKRFLFTMTAHQLLGSGNNFEHFSLEDDDNL